nr:mobility-associated LCxxNW protein [uncultured Blautia sp.]
MNDPRPFCKDHKCIKWTDELLRYELEEANDVCHGNWIEIQHQREYTITLRKQEIRQM